MTIRTNHHWRDFISGWDMPDSVRADFDYLSDDEYHDATFIKYRGEYMSLDQFMRFDGNRCPDWHGYHGDSYFSATLIRISDDGEQYQVARAYS